MRAVNAVCRLDEMEEVRGDDSCVVPLAADDEPLDDFARAPLVLKIACVELVELVGTEAADAKRPVSCSPLGRCYTLDVHDEVFQKSIAERYPGFAGEVMEPPTAEDLEDEADVRTIFLGMFGIGATGLLGGGYVLVLLWRRRKRATAA